MKRSLLTVVLLVFLSACSSATYDTISLDEIHSYIEQEYIIVDVREPNEYAEGHIPGAINVPLSGLQQGNLAPLEKDANYIIICRSGNRSQTASDILYKEGYTVINTSDGMYSWSGEIE
ncbi:rhodanese-like domain-containing protein [Solibacillus sp. CAU 1738]|uniref:rhodanese-like domain-containing protein n=1 Tax=Solibacillus sp. CAU 1738 TaxID=3140363 RepID=UPI0032617BA4